MPFDRAALILRPLLEEFARRVWREQLGCDDCPEIDALGPVADEQGNASFRRLLQQMEAWVRSAKAGPSRHDRPSRNPPRHRRPTAGRPRARRGPPDAETRPNAP